MTGLSEIELGILMERIGQVESEARALCRKALTTNPELRPHTALLESAIRRLDAHPAIVAMRPSSGEG